MSRQDTTSAIIDRILELGLTTGAIAVGLVLPNLLVALDKPFKKYYKLLDKRDHERELRRILVYMKHRGYVAKDYQHGLVVTRKGKQRLKASNITNLSVQYIPKWDHLWRLVLYDIPESHKVARNSLTSKLRRLGFYQLQRSAWIHPLPVRDVIELVTTFYDIEKFVSYIETGHLDNEVLLVKHFKKLLPDTKF